MFFEKYRILLWKNWTIQKRHYKSGIFEVIFPVIFVIFFTWNKSQYGKDEISSVEYDESLLSDRMYCSSRDLINNIHYSPRSPWIDNFLRSAFDVDENITIFDYENAQLLDTFLADENYFGFEFEDSLLVKTQLVELP